MENKIGTNIEKSLSIGNSIYYFFLKPNIFFDKYKSNPTYQFKFIVICFLILIDVFFRRYLNNLMIISNLDEINKLKTLLGIIQFFIDNILSLGFISTILVLNLFLINWFYYLLIKSVDRYVEYKSVLSVYFHSYIILIIGYILYNFIDYSLGKPLNIPLDSGFISILLNSIRIPTILFIIIMTIGISRVFHVSKRKSLLIALIGFILTIAFNSMLAFLSTY